MKNKILTLTLNPALDKNSGINNVVPNQKLRCKTPNYEAGGGGINVSRAIKSLGGESLAIFPCGGSNGEKIKSSLQDEDIEFLLFPIDEESRENLTVFEGNSKQQFRFIMPGPTLSEKTYELILDEINSLDSHPDFLVVSGSTPNGVPEDFYKKIANAASGMDCRLIVDTSAEHLKQAAEAGVYLLKPNMRELGFLSDSEIESEESQIEAARNLVDSGQAKIVVVSLGAGGALLVTEDSSEQLRSPTVPIRSKLGAGDSMVAGIVLSLARGKSIRDSTLYGIAAGAATVMTEGTMLCTKDDTDHLYESLINNS